MCPFPLLLQLSRTDTKLFLKTSAKIFWVGETHTIGHLTNAELVGKQQLVGLIQANGFDEVVTVELLDEDEDVAYTDWLTPGQTSLVFPNSLSGEYNVRLTVGSVYYIGVIEL